MIRGSGIDCNDLLASLCELMGLDGKGMSYKIRFFSLINFESSILLRGCIFLVLRIMHVESIMNMARSTLAVTSIASSYVRRGE